MLEALREELWRLHLELPKNELVKWTGGNISARDPESNLVVIKPSGVRYEQLRPEDMVVVDLEGSVVEGTHKPSSDTQSHLYIYRHRPDVGGIVHTHSPYATAFAALGRPIPVVLTAMADEFGGPIPCGRFALIGSEAIGEAVLEAIGDSSAVLLKHHGVFTVGVAVGPAGGDSSRGRRQASSSVHSRLRAIVRAETKGQRIALWRFGAQSRWRSSSLFHPWPGPL